MIKKVLDGYIYKVLNEKIGFDNISEIRLRENKPIIINSFGQLKYLSTTGCSLNKQNSIYATKKMIEDIIFKASEFSIYSVNEELKQGYLIMDGGERIGVCGTMILENGKVKTISSFSSLNIRIPHEIKGSSLPYMNKLLDGNFLRNVLIVSPPGQGKTTFIRDFVYQLSQIIPKNVLIIDERGEIAGKNNKIDLGGFNDVISFSDKQTGFLLGIRAMNPDLIVTDELGEIADYDSVNFASNCGVKILATIHADSITQLRQKRGFEKISGVFDRYVVLRRNGKPGVVDGVYDKTFQKIL